MKNNCTKKKNATTILYLTILYFGKMSLSVGEMRVCSWAGLWCSDPRTEQSWNLKGLTDSGNGLDKQKS